MSALVDGVDHVAGGEKEERLKKAWSRNCTSRRRRRRSHREDHQPDLGHRGVGDHPLDVDLGEGDEAAITAVPIPTQATSPTRSGQREESVEARDQVDAAVTMVAAWISAETG